MNGLFVFLVVVFVLIVNLLILIPYLFFVSIFFISKCVKSLSGDSAMFLGSVIRANFKFSNGLEIKMITKGNSQ